MSRRDLFKVGDTVIFYGTDRDQYIENGMTAQVTERIDDDYRLLGKDCDGDDGEWYCDGSGIVLDSEDVTVVKGHNIDPKRWVKPGIQVVFHGTLDGSIELDNHVGTVARGPDGDGDFWVDFDDPRPKDEGGGEVDGTYVLADGKAGAGEYGYHVTPVTTSSVGNTTERLQLFEFQRVIVRTGSITDNRGLSIDGLIGTVNRATASPALLPSGRTDLAWWIQFTVSDGSEDGFFANVYGDAIEFPDLRAERMGTGGQPPLPERQLRRTTVGADALIAEFDAMTADKAPAVDEGTTFNTIERGHISADGEVFPWPPPGVTGPVPVHPIRINGELCQPVARKVVTTYYEWKAV